jgi:hypothetical protein
MADHGMVRRRTRLPADASVGLIRDYFKDGPLARDRRFLAVTA